MKVSGDSLIIFVTYMCLFYSLTPEREHHIEDASVDSVC